MRPPPPQPPLFPYTTLFRSAEVAGKAQPHRQGGGVPTARRQPGKRRMARLILIEMEGLRIELGGEGFDCRFIDDPRCGGEFLADLQIFEIAGLDHRASFRGANGRLVKSAGRDGRNQTPEATAADNMTPYVTSPALNAAKTDSTVPVSENAIQPPPTAMTSRTSPADNGHNSRPAPCDAK